LSDAASPRLTIAEKLGLTPHEVGQQPQEAQMKDDAG
jgi:hypothetical protein